MTKTYESIKLNGTGRNAESLGALIAWLVANNLLEPGLEQSAGSSVARVRMQDLTGPEFLTTVLHGEFKPEHLNEVGQGFVESYFLTGVYQTDYERCEYAGENEWLRFDELSPKISAAFREHNKPKTTLRSLGAKIIKFPVRSR